MSSNTDFSRNNRGHGRNTASEAPRDTKFRVKTVKGLRGDLHGELKISYRLLAKAVDSVLKGASSNEAAYKAMLAHFQLEVADKRNPGATRTILLAGVDQPDEAGRYVCHADLNKKLFRALDSRKPQEAAKRTFLLNAKKAIANRLRDLLDARIAELELEFPAPLEGASNSKVIPATKAKAATPKVDKDGFTQVGQTKSTNSTPKATTPKRATPKRTQAKSTNNPFAILAVAEAEAESPKPSDATAKSVPAVAEVKTPQGVWAQGLSEVVKTEPTAEQAKAMAEARKPKAELPAGWVELSMDSTIESMKTWPKAEAKVTDPWADSAPFVVDGEPKEFRVEGDMPKVDALSLATAALMGK